MVVKVGVGFGGAGCDAVGIDFEGCCEWLCGVGIGFGGVGFGGGWLGLFFFGGGGVMVVVEKGRIGVLILKAERSLKSPLAGTKR